VLTTQRPQQTWTLFTAVTCTKGPELRHIQQGDTQLCRYITPPGTGFLPRETAVHHQQHVVALVQEALQLAKLRPSDIDAIAFTKVLCHVLLPHHVATCMRQNCYPSSRIKAFTFHSWPSIVAYTAYFPLDKSTLSRQDWLLFDLRARLQCSRLGWDCAQGVNNELVKLTPKLLVLFCGCCVDEHLQEYERHS
jgi:hypothetical protein